jgi:hypothetical protein
LGILKAGFSGLLPIPLELLDAFLYSRFVIDESFAGVAHDDDYKRSGEC